MRSSLIALFLPGLLLAPLPAVAARKAPPPPVVEALPPPPPDPLAERPVVAPAPAYVPPSAVAGTLSNGASLWVVPSSALPIFSLVISVPGGTSLDRPGREGTGALAMEMMRRGAGERDAEAFAAEVARRGLSIDTGADADGAYIAVSGVASELDAALDLVADAILRPRFARGEVKKARELMIAGLEESLSEPAWVAARTATSLYWGPTHPYGRPSDGTTRGLAATTRRDVRAWHHAVWVSNHARFTAAGDVSLAALTQKLEARLGANWPAGKSAPVPEITTPGHQAEPIYLVDSPDSAQTGFYLAFPGLKMGDPGTAPARAGTIALGGTFTSRLNGLLREKRGYTYGVRATLAPMLGAGTLVIRTRIRADVTGAALVDLVGELDGIRKGIAPEELVKAQGAFRQDLVETMETVGGTAGTFAAWHAAGGEPDVLGRELAAINAVDLASVTPAMANYDPAKAVFVLVGDRKLVEPQLAAAGFTRVTVVTPP